MPYYAILANDLGLIFYRWTESKVNCLLKEGAYTGGGWLTGNRKHCNPIWDGLSTDPMVASTYCMPNQQCRACSRMTNVIVNTTLLQELFEEALVKRSTCIAKHPLYSP